jgi:Tol biopolymer transport system component
MLSMRKASSRYRLVLLALTGILGLGSCVNPMRPLRDSRGLLLVVRGDYGPGTEIYAMRSDGSEMRRLTQNNVLDSHPDWSPDGERVVFVSHPDSIPGQSNRRPDIFVMNEDGSEMRRLFQSSLYATHPSWSPDGSRIAFENYDPAVGESRVYVMDADGSNVRQIPSAAGPNYWPEWSPDGTRILFVSSRPPRGLWTMYVVNADGTGERQLSDDSACLSHISVPKWTPDGSRIGYLCDSDVGAIYTVRADGTDRRLLIPPRADKPSYEYAPVWSRDGSQVAFASDRDTPEHLSEPAWHIFVANASGGSITRITSDSAGYHVTDWGPPR